MVSITNTSIFLTRGDSLQIQLALTKNGESFTPSANDTIKFYLSNAYKGHANYHLYAEKTIDNQTLVLQLAPEDTAEMPYGTYCYDLEITYSDGAVDTFVSGKLTLTGECG